MNRKHIIMIILVGIICLLTFPAHAEDNPFPLKPKITPQEGDTMLVKVPYLTLRNALFMAELYAEMHSYVNEILVLYTEAEKSVEDLSKSKQFYKGLSTGLTVGLGIVAIGVLVSVVLKRVESKRTE